MDSEVLGLESVPFPDKVMEAQCVYEWTSQEERYA